MPRSLSARWIPLFAALLAGPLVQGWTGETWSAQATLRGVDTAASAAGYAYPVVRLQLALQRRSPLDRHSVPLFLSLPAQADGLRLGDETGRLPQHRHSAPALGSSRHFPLFPTGPPRHN